MAKLTTLKPRIQAMDTSRLSAKPAGESGNGWGSGRGGRPWRRKREEILQRDLYTCQYCRLVTLDLEVDHIINKAQGGTDDDSNLQSLCIPCHKLKTASGSLAGRS
ncbi:HNH endonuclease [Pseudomonas sp. Marseille-Q5115]|uniref:HNH endonuclease n=1 Tax=Pseudomonas sp. Marseille-Q5115 TaxID=2866593 RepID=UPI0039A6373C